MHRFCLPAILASAGLCAPGLAGAATSSPPTVDVTINDKGCEPMQLSAPAVQVAFKIRNASRRAVEWEILKGDRVVEERENILPGFTSTLTTKLDPAEYAMTCGLLSNPKGTLTVQGVVAQPDGKRPADLAPIIARYKSYVADEVTHLVANTRTLVAAVRAGKLAEAQRAYAPAHLHYERIEPVAEVFNDLDKSMDSRADDFEKREADPNFSGYHRIEYGLFKLKTTAGLDGYADKLLREVLDLQGRIAKLDITPKILVGGAADLIEEVAAKKISGEEDRYSKTDLWDFQGNLDGAQKIVALLRPDLSKRDPQLLARVDGNFAKVDADLARYREPDGSFQSYDALKPIDQKKLRGPITVLAEDLSRLRGTLGID